MEWQIVLNATEENKVGKGVDERVEMRAINLGHLSREALTEKSVLSKDHKEVKE